MATQPGEAALRLDRAELERRIAERAARFDLPALFDALLAAGYRAPQITWRSEPSLRHGAALVQSVAFERAPHRAIVTLNLGLLNSQGPLPRYFWELLSEQRDSDMSEFLWFFDQHLLGQRVRSLFPERDPEALPQWPGTKRRMLLLVRLASPSGVHWLLERTFPELEVQVRRAAGERTLRTKEFQIAGTEMGGGATLGGLTTLPVDGTEVLLLCPPDAAAEAAKVIESVQQRLREEVLPLLDEQNPYLFLRVYLVFRGALSRVALASDRYVGVNRVYGSQVPGEQVEQLLLWNGEVRTAMSHEQLNFRLSLGTQKVPTERIAAGGRTARME